MKDLSNINFRQQIIYDNRIKVPSTQLYVRGRESVVVEASYLFTYLLHGAGSFLRS